MIARLIAIALSVVALLAPASAEPVKDTIKLLRQGECMDNLSDRECFRFHGERMAFNLGYQEGALTICPDLYVTDQKLRDLRWKKYRKYDKAFQEGWDSVVGERKSPLAKVMPCFQGGDDASSTDPYGQTWLKRDEKHGYTDGMLAKDKEERAMRNCVVAHRLVKLGMANDENRARAASCTPTRTTNW
jgi:hypothetical protein